jgi:hypothetical protein
VPQPIEWLPRKGLISAQVHYFHDWGSLNRRYLLAEENLLELDRNTEGVLARYRRGPEPAGQERPQPSVLVVIKYPSEPNAERAYRRFVSGYLPDADEAGAARTENNLWAGCRRMGTAFVGVFDAPDRAEVLGLISEVSQARGR